MRDFYVSDSTGNAFKPSAITILTDDATLNASHVGGLVGIATDAKTITLPLITTALLGMEFTILNTGADGNNIITLSPNALDGFNGTIANAAADSVASGVVNKNIVNTKTTANKGDLIKVKAVSLTEWYIVYGVGIWASEG